MKTFQEFQTESKSQEFKNRLENLKKRSATTDAAAQKTKRDARERFKEYDDAHNKTQQAIKDYMQAG